MLYHKDVYLPKGLALPTAPFGLWWSGHARRACLNDRYGVIEPPTGIDPRSAQVIEVETDSAGRAVKVVYRQPYRAGLSLCIVVLLDGYVVKTAWLNQANDRHSTLDTRRYAAQ